MCPIKEKGQFRLIHRLSFPVNSSIKEFITDSFSKDDYATFDDAVDITLLLAKDFLLSQH